MKTANETLGNGDWAGEYPYDKRVVPLDTAIKSMDEYAEEYAKAFMEYCYAEGNYGLKDLWLEFKFEQDKKKNGGQ